MHSSKWKGIFWLVETLFYLVFRYFCQWLLFFLVQWKRIFETNPSLQLVETNFLPFLVKAFSVQCKLIFQQILHSGQWRLIFWLVKTILFIYLKYPFHLKQFFHLLAIYFKRILYYSQWQRIFCLVETIFFYSHFFLETIIAIRGRPIFFKKSHFCWRKPFSSIFFRY